MKGFGKVFKFEWLKNTQRNMFLVFLILAFLFPVIGNGVNYYLSEVWMPRFEEQTQSGETEEEGEGTLTLNVFRPPTAEETKAQLESEIAPEPALRNAKSPDYSDAHLQNAENDLAVLNYKLRHGLIKPEDSYQKEGYDLQHNDNRAWQAAAAGGSSTLLYAFAVTYLAVIVAGEYEKGTLKSLVIRPAGRRAILAAKYLNTLLFLFLLMLADYIGQLLSGMLLFGAGDPASPMVYALFGRAFELPLGLAGLLLFVLQFVSSLMPLAMTLLLAVLLRSAAGTIALSLSLALIGSPLILQLAKFMNGLRFTSFVHEDLSVYLSSGIRVDSTNILFSAVLALLYTVIFLFAASWLFRKRDI